MEPVKPPSIINEGIAVYVPPIINEKLVNTIDIFYSKNPPMFKWIGCDNTQSKIWSYTKYQSEKGDLFLYKNRLIKGFYTIRISLVKKDGGTKQGQTTIGIIEPTPYIIIGLPYSIYPVISVS